MFKKMVLSLAMLTTLFLLSSTMLMAEENSSSAKGDQQRKQSPFLITGELPHLTKMLMQQWDNATLQLTEEQKALLLVVREETMTGVKSLAPQIAPLQKMVKEGVFRGKTPDELRAVVQDIAMLKTKATMIHLKCIYDTREILNRQQLDLLLRL